MYFFQLIWTAEIDFELISLDKTNLKSLLLVIGKKYYDMEILLVQDGTKLTFLSFNDVDENAILPF